MAVDKPVNLLVEMFVLCCFFSIPVSSAEDAIRIGNTPQLFVDDYLIASMETLRRVDHQAMKLNGGEPIFTGGKFYGTVLHDQGKFKMWWRHDDLSGYSYAESYDGIKFETKAKISGIPYAGDVNLAVEVDPNSPSKASRYVAGYDAPGMAAGIAVSSDGVRWIALNDGKRVTHRAADTYNQILWDPKARHYKLLTRTDFGSAGGGGEVRGHRVMTNPNLHDDPENWTLQREWIFDKQGASEIQRRQIYALTDWIYHGQHFALMSVYEHIDDFSEGAQNKMARHDKDIMNVYLGTSRDGMNWDDRLVYEQRPLIQRGGRGSFDNGIVLAASSIVTHANRHWIYYCGWNERHGNPQNQRERDSAIGVATMRLEGFRSLHAGPQEGVMETKPFVVDGSQMLLNLFAKKGKVEAELLDEQGKPISGFSGRQAAVLQEVDEVRAPVVWRTSLQELNGRTVVLRLTMKNSDVYAMMIVK